MEKKALLQKGISLYEKALEEQKNKNEKEAKKKFQEALESVDEKSLVAAASHFYIGLSYLQKENGKEAVKNFKKTKKIYKKNLPESEELGRTFFYMARGYEWQKQYKNAIQAIDSAIKICKRREEYIILSELALFKANIYYEQGKYKKSIDQAKKAQEMHEEFEKSKKNNQIGEEKRNIMTQEKGKIAILIGKALNRIAENAKGKEKKLKILEEIKQYQKASALYEEAVEHYENSAHLYKEKYIRFEKERLTEYIKELKEKIKKLKSYYPEEFSNKPEDV